MAITTVSTSTGVAITGTGEGELLTGGSGNDVIISNGGTDTIDGGAGSDTAAFLAVRSAYSWTGSADDLVLHPILGGGDKQVTNVETIQFRDVTVSTSSLFATVPDAIITGTGDGEFLAGTAANDLIISNGGTDTVEGGSGSDTVAFLADQSFYSWTGTADDFVIHPILGGGDKHVTNVEAVQFRDVTVTSASLFPTPAAAPAAVTTNTVTGTGDADSLVGTGGNDLLVSNGGADTMDGGAGIDTAAFLAARSDYSVTGNAGNFTVSPISGGGDKLVLNVETVQFRDGTVSSAELLQGAAPSTATLMVSAPIVSAPTVSAPTSPTYSIPAGANIIHMGANQTYKTLGSALGAARDGDVIQVDAGTYYDDSATVTKSVTIEGVGGRAHFHATGNIANDKGILVDDAASLTIRNLEFSGAQVADGNGAGIRHEAGTLTILHSFFHDNENGIMGGVVAGGRIIIDGSQFLHNGAGDAQTHSVYAGGISALTVTNSSFIDANNGIDLKSRAASNDIRNNAFVDSSNGTTTYQIDLPNGHDATISGNVFYKSADTGNRATIHFGGELAGAWGNLVVQNNKFWSDRDPTSAVLNHTGSTVTFSNNSLESTVSIAVDQGPGAVSGNLTLTGNAPLPLTLF